MAEKYSVLIKYKYLDFIEDAKLSDADAWVFIKGLIEYDKTGKTPRYKKQILTGMFTVLKRDLDENRTKWEETIKAKSVAGKKGMEKRWGGKKEEITPITGDNTDNSDNNSYQKITAITKITDLDSGSDLDLVSEFDSGGGNGREEEKKPPPVLQIKKESGGQGFFIDDTIARKFQTCGVNPSWLTGPHSFLEFAAARVRKKYHGKDGDELKPIFISAVSSWEDLREAYPRWRDEQEKEAHIKAHNEAIKKAKRERPKKCQCGGELNGSLCCESCNGFYMFNEETSRYDFNQPATKNILADFSEYLRGRGHANGG